MAEEDIPIEDLKGVGDKTATSLREAGYFDVLSVARTSSGTLADVTGMTDNKADTIITNAREHIKSDSFATGKEVQEQQSELKRISTGSNAFNDLMYGGVPTNYITETYGAFGSGKTQISHQLAVNVQRPIDEGGLGRECIFIDTEDTFTADRVVDMAKAHGMDPDEALENIYVAKAFDSGHQINVTKDAYKMCAENDVGLVIVDSIIAHFRADYGGRGELADRQDKLNSHLKDLKRIASTFDIAVYITNQIMHDPGEMFGNPIKPVGGNILAHASAFRIWLRSKKNSNVARLVDSPNLPPGEAEFVIETDGIRDV